ncbi:MAG: hypothetical protein JNJ77_22220 [Planctomycetia bacterium]|nr:hypothetical protein [Planctomycetia bacterium]
MKRLALALVAVFALLFTVETAKADWYVFVGASGFVHWEYDGTFGDGDFDPPVLPPLPPGNNYFLQYQDDFWYIYAY